MFQDSFDYSSFIYVGILAGVAQAQNSYPEFHQGAAGYGRFYCPAEVGKRHPLGGTAVTDTKITLLDGVARFGEQPLAQVPQDLLDSAPQFLDGDFAHVGSARGCSELCHQFRDEFVGMTFNQSDQT